MGKPTFSHDNLQNALRLIKDGKSVSYTSKLFKISQKTLTYNIKKNNVDKKCTKFYKNFRPY